MPIIGRKALADPVITYSHNGRGAWPASGAGGTLNLKGEVPGAFYRAPAGGAPFVMPGRTAAVAIKNRQVTTINDYAVYGGVVAIQSFLVMPVVDGVFGPKTGEAVRQYQIRQNLVADGVVGPNTAKAMFKPLVLAAATAADFALKRLGPVTIGTIAWESRFDPGAVGYTTPNDIGIGQINGPAHPSLSVTDRLTPSISIAFVVGLVRNNLRAFPGNERAGIAAYNLGLAGARAWVKAGSPDVYGKTDVNKYINAVLAGI